MGCLGFTLVHICAMNPGLTMNEMDLKSIALAEFHILTYVCHEPWFHNESTSLLKIGAGLIHLRGPSYFGFRYTYKTWWNRQGWDQPCLNKPGGIPETN